MPEKKKLVIFDFDGVISDSFEYCFRINRSLQPKINRENYRSLFEGNFYESLCKIFAPDKVTEEYKQKYWDYFIAEIDQIFLVQGMKEVLALLSKNYTLAIVSSADSKVINTVLANEKVRDLFEEIYGSDIHESKDHKFQMIFEKFDISAKDCIFVTDTLGDLIEAERAGIESIAVSWGFHDKKTLDRGKYKLMVHKPEELVGEIKKHFND